MRRPRSPPGSARASRLDGGVEGEEIRLPGDRGDRVDDPDDLLRGLGKLGNELVGAPRRRDRLADFEIRLIHGAVDLARGGGEFLGRGGERDRLGRGPFAGRDQLAHVRADVIDVVPGRADVAAGRGDGLGHAADGPEDVGLEDVHHLAIEAGGRSVLSGRLGLALRRDGRSVTDGRLTTECRQHGYGSPSGIGRDEASHHEALGLTTPSAETRSSALRLSAAARPHLPAGAVFTGDRPTGTRPSGGRRVGSGRPPHAAYRPCRPPMSRA